MKETSVADKILASVINVAIVFLSFLLVNYLIPSFQYRKSLFIVLFFIYNILIVFINKGRCIGMMLTKLHWEKEYPLKNHCIYVILYTVSFASLLFSLYFILDLLLINIFLIQLPFVLLKKTTLHGYLSGNMIAV
jgi:hypothetical protein